MISGLRLRKVLALVLAVALASVSALLLLLAVWRAGLPYNEEGRYFDAADAVVYHEQAVAVYALLGLLASAAAVGALLWAIRLWRAPLP